MSPEEEAKIRDLDALSQELMAITDRPEQPGDGARIEALAAETEATIRELDGLREAREKKLADARQRERRATRIRVGVCLIILACVLVYFVMQQNGLT